jgi:hypothetical protein
LQTSLRLSAVLLHAILNIYQAHTETSKSARMTETILNRKLNDMDVANGKLEAELRRCVISHQLYPTYLTHNFSSQRSAFSQKAQECQSLMSKERLLNLEQDSSSSRVEVRRLEDKVAKLSAKSSSVEEVSTLHKELQEWLASATEEQVHNLPSSFYAAHLTPP